jgi:hypothetical protein
MGMVCGVISLKICGFPVTVSTDQCLMMFNDVNEQTKKARKEGKTGHESL